MTRFVVLIRGDGFDMDGTDAFLTVRATSARGQSEAEAKAMASVAEDWRSGESALLDPGAEPRLTVVASWRGGLLGRKLPDAGHTFFSTGDADSRSAAYRIEVDVAAPPLLLRREIMRRLQAAS